MGRSRRKPRLLARLTGVIGLAVLAAGWYRARATTLSPAPRERDPHVLDGSAHVALGVPSDATPNDDLLQDRGAYVLSYDEKRRVAHWVAWELDASHLGATGRSGEFTPDELLPPGVYRVQKRDYSRSGYERGHLCPSGDRTRDYAENARTFLMTNMHPQVHDLNSGPWEKLERYERELATRPGARVYIVAGGVFDAAPRTIGPGIAVPRASFKAVVPLAAGQTAKDVARSVRAFAVLMPNEAGVDQRPWTDYVTSIDAVEAATGYDLFARVPDDVESVIESRRVLP